MTAGTSRPVAGRPAVLLVVFLVGLAGVWLALGRSREERSIRDAWPRVQGSLVVSGLSAPVRVSRDGRGVAHLEATSEIDAWRALGFVHAQDRLAQMVWLSRVAQGRAAELGGSDFVPADRRARLLGIAHHAGEQAGELERGTARVLDAYAAGVNARIARIRAGEAAAPRALQALGVELEDWTAADTLALVKLHAWSLSDSLATSLVLLDLIRHLGAIGARPFFPAGAGIGAVPIGTEARPAPGAAPDPLRRAAGLAGPGVGSTAWVVAGSLAAGGRPLLAGDLHLEPTLPALLYEVHVRGGDLDVAGATLPGVPVFWTGRNPRVAWAAVHARAVVADLFAESVEPGGTDRHHDGRRMRPLEVREERIEVRGGEGELLRVRSSRHGPLLDGLLAEGDEPLSLAWTGARTDPGLAGLLGVARARDAEELRRALRRHREPVVAVAYADVEGAGGVQVAGWVPRRRYPAGLVPVPGRSAVHAWEGPVPPEALPHVRLSRGRRWAVAADNALGGDSAGAVEWLWRPGVRAAHVEALLREASARGPLDAGGMAALQADVHSAGARRFLRDALALAERGGPLAGEAAEVASLLREWEGDAGASSVGAALYHVFVHELVEAVFQERLGPERLARWRSLPHVDAGELVARLLRSAASGGGRDPAGWDDPARLGEAVRASLRAAWLELSVRAGPNRDKWTWGRLHLLRFRPLLPVSRGIDPGEGPFEAAGDGRSIASAAYDPAHPFDVRVASTHRFAVDLAEPGHALSALAPGPSEHPGHPDRVSGLERWLAGRASLLVSSPVLVEEGSVATLTLEPAP